MKAYLIILIIIFLCYSATAQLTYEWASDIGGNEYETSQTMDIDSVGNIYMAGVFRDTVDFDPGAGIMEAFPNGSYTIFMAKYDLNSNLLWVKTIGGGNLSYNFCYSLKIDNEGDIYIVGYFEGNADFDPGPGVAILQGGGSSYFIAKYTGMEIIYGPSSLMGSSMI